MLDEGLRHLEENELSTYGLSEKSCCLQRCYKAIVYYLCASEERRQGVKQ